MSHRAGSEGGNARRRSSTPDHSHRNAPRQEKICAWCDSQNTVFVQRGFAGGQRSKDQYIRCLDCERITYEIIATTDRDIRIHRYQSGGTYRDAAHQTRYTIYRMLKVGFNEFLLYLRPVMPTEPDKE